MKTRGGGFVFVGEDVRRIIRNSPTVVSKVNTGIDVDRQIMRRLSAPCSPLCSSKKRARSGLEKRSQSTRINSLQPASLETISKIICCKFHGALFDSKVTTNIRTLELTHFFGHHPRQCGACFLYGTAGHRSLGHGNSFSSFRLVRPRTRRKGAFPPFTLIAFLPPCPRLKGKLRLFFNANIPRFP